MTATECVQFCNKTQAYLQLPLCRCGLDESLLPMTEDLRDLTQAIQQLTLVTRDLAYLTAAVTVQRLDASSMDFDCTLGFPGEGPSSISSSTSWLLYVTKHLAKMGIASAEGLGTVDVLFGTYYTATTSLMLFSPQVVHVILAVDIDMKRVLTSVTLPVTLVNIQINSLNHELYGAGADLTGQYAYYHLCTSTNLTQTVNGITTRQISVGCTLAELGELPTEVNYLYLQSAAIDHQNNYAWFTYKEDATGRPRILEYHQDSHVVRYGHADSLPENAVFSSLIQTAPRIFFALFPPSLLYARFNAAGTKLFLSFDAATLRGAAPIDTNADDIPDSFNEADKATRAPCEDFIDQFTMTLIPGSMCQWTSDADFYIEIDQSCTDLTLDGTQSRNHGYRGTFTWALSSTNPVKPEPHIRQLQKVIDDEMLAALPAELLELLDCLQQGECWSCWSFECNELTLQYVL
ncbi:unnamed protein product [Durusdinium trenchii]|uniref:Uncharacterized protein n=1 Tax=Durusdinium trenchii TaxID=1381693 RepID=A0ABP0IAT1_9DINO